MKTLVILNPQAAKGAAQKHFPQISEYLQNHGLEFDCEKSEYAAHAEEIAYNAIKTGYDKIVSVGGDGTLNEILNGIMKADGDPILGIIPAGTCNDFIKSTGISNVVEQASATVAKGTPRRFDVARVGDRFSINAAGVGFDVAVTETLKKNKYLSGITMYMKAVLTNLFRYKGLDLTIINGQAHFERKALMLTVANGRCYGGNFHIAPNADAADGFLNAILIKDLSPLKRLNALLRVLKGTHLELPEVETFKTQELKIIANHPLTVQIEGELLKWPSNEIMITMLPKRLKILVPEQSNPKMEGN